MMEQDSDALECDLAETYGLFDLGSVPVRKLAVLACGLRENSRIKQKISGVETDIETLLLGLAVDRLSWLVWAKTTDGQKGRNRPKSVLDVLLGNTSQEKIEADVFKTPEEFDAAREKILRDIEAGETDA